MHYFAGNTAITPELLALAVGSEQLQSAWAVLDKARSGPASGPTQLGAGAGAGARAGA